MRDHAPELHWAYAGQELTLLDGIGPRHTHEHFVGERVCILLVAVELPRQGVGRIDTLDCSIGEKCDPVRFIVVPDRNVTTTEIALPVDRISPQRVHFLPQRTIGRQSHGVDLAPVACSRGIAQPAARNLANVGIELHA